MGFPSSSEQDFLEKLAGSIAALEQEVRRLGVLPSSGAFLNLGTGSTLTIAAGEITVVESYHRVDTQGGAGTDNLDTINGGSNGDILVLRSIDSTRDVTLRDGVDNLRLAGNFTLASVQDVITLIQREGGVWNEVSRSDN